MLTQNEKDILFEMIQTGYLTLERNDEIRANDELARQDIAVYKTKRLSDLNAQISELTTIRAKYE